MEIPEATIQQKRLQVIAEKRKRQAEIENKRRQLEDDRRQLQHLKSKALRERWLLEGAPSSTSEEEEAIKHQMQEDEMKSKELEESVQMLEKELEMLENGDSATSTNENLAEAAIKEEKREEVKTANSMQKTPLATAEEKKPSKSPVKMIEGSDMLRAAMYSVEITVEKDKVTGETKVLSSTTLLPQDLSLQGVKVYEDELKVVHEVRVDDIISHNDVHLLSSSEVDELIHKADEVSDIEKTEDVGKGDTKDSKPSSQTQTPRKEITGVQTKPAESPKIQSNQKGGEPSKEQPVTMIFMGYQNVEDENETKKVLGLEGTIKAELVVIEDADKVVSADSRGKEHAPPNGSTAEPTVLPQKEDNQVLGEKPEANDRDAKGGEQDLDMKKHRCKCCTVM